MSVGGRLLKYYSLIEAAPIMGGSLDGAGNASLGYSLRGGRMLTTDNYECTWDLYKSIPSFEFKGQNGVQRNRQVQ